MSELLEHRSVPLGRLYVSITVAGMVVRSSGAYSPAASRF